MQKGIYADRKRIHFLQVYEVYLLWFLIFLEWLFSYWKEDLVTFINMAFPLFPAYQTWRSPQQHTAWNV
jgi:hypothetical protein